MSAVAGLDDITPKTLKKTYMHFVYIATILVNTINWILKTSEVYCLLFQKP